MAEAANENDTHVAPRTILCSTAMWIRAPPTRSLMRFLAGRYGFARNWPRKDERTPPSAHQLPVKNARTNEPRANPGITQERAVIRRTALKDFEILTKSRAAGYSMP